MNIFEMMRERYFLPKKPKLFEAFSGIGCQRLAFKRLGIEVEMIGISEIDKYAIQSYMAIHGETKNYGSITDIKGQDLPQIDVFTWSFPCTDLSKAGKQKGLTNTKSGLVYEVLRILQESTNKPKVLIMENVVDLVQTKFIAEFNEIQLELEQLGYVNYVETMNSKDFGVAQNRDRVFMVSILGDYYYEFPKPFKLEKRLKDYLEDEVDEKYYIKDFESLTDINENYGQLNGGKWEKLHDIGRRVYSYEFVSPTIHTMQGGNLEPKVVVPFGSYYTWPDNQGNINTQCNRAADEDGYALTVACAETGKVAIKEDNIITPLFILDLCGIIDVDRSEQYEKSRELLQVLWREITKEEIWEEIGRLLSVYQENILQQRVHEKGFFENWGTQSNDNKFKNNSEKNKRVDIEERLLRDMWEEFKDRYTPHRWELEQQQFDKLNGFMSKLPQQTTQNEEEMYDLRRKSEGVRVLQQTLLALQKIWRPTKIQEQSEILRIRKLSPIEVWRLMGIDDEDFEKASKVCSNSQLYKQAGNGIVVDVFVKIIENMTKGDV